MSIIGEVRLLTVAWRRRRGQRLDQELDWHTIMNVISYSGCVSKTYFGPTMTMSIDSFLILSYNCHDNSFQDGSKIDLRGN